MNISAHMCFLISLLFAKAQPQTKDIETNEHDRNITAVPFRFVHSSVGVSFSFYLLEAISQKAGKGGKNTI